MWREIDRDVGVVLVCGLYLDREGGRIFDGEKRPSISPFLELGMEAQLCFYPHHQDFEAKRHQLNCRVNNIKVALQQLIEKGGFTLDSVDLNILPKLQYLLIMFPSESIDPGFQNSYIKATRLSSRAYIQNGA